MENWWNHSYTLEQQCSISAAHGITWGALKNMNIELIQRCRHGGAALVKGTHNLRLWQVFIITVREVGASLASGPWRPIFRCSMSLGSFRERAWSQDRDLSDKQLPHHLLTGSSMDNAKMTELMEIVVLLNGREYSVQSLRCVRLFATP